MYKYTSNMEKQAIACYGSGVNIQASIAQWTEQFRPKEEMRVRFLLGAILAARSWQSAYFFVFVI